jgi:hypothetical protein
MVLVYHNRNNHVVLIHQYASQQQTTNKWIFRYDHVGFTLDFGGILLLLKEIKEDGQDAEFPPRNR